MLPGLQFANARGAHFEFGGETILAFRLRSGAVRVVHQEELDRPGRPVLWVVPN